MGAREERIARNEALFRTVNERVVELAVADPAGDEPVRFVCECGQADCADPVDLTLGEYERVRSDPRQFLIVRGHEIPEVEDVVERNEGYDVVRKHEDETKIAIETDPRA